MLLLEYLEYIPAGICIVIFVWGCYLAFLSNAKYGLVMTLQNALGKNSETDRFFARTGIKLNTAGYKMILFIIALIILLIGFFLMLKYMKIGYLLLSVLIAFLTVFLLQPKENLFGNMDSPFIMVIRAITKSRGTTLDNEIFNSCITLKNLAIVQQESPLSADLMFEHIMENSNKLKPIYAEMISQYRSGNPKAAFSFFANTVGTKMGRTFAGVLAKLDRINPTELTEQITTLQEAMSEERLSLGIKKAERNGATTMLLATACTLALLLNFAFVVIFMDTMNMLSNVFG